MPHGALVEAVDLELQAMEAELLEHVPLEEARGLVSHPPAAEVRVHGSAPLFKVYLINEQDLFFGYYPARKAAGLDPIE